MIISSICAGSSNSPITLTFLLSPSATTLPPERVRFSAEIAFSMSVKVTFLASSLKGSTFTSTSFSSTPTIFTFDISLNSSISSSRYSAISLSSSKDFEGSVRLRLSIGKFSEKLNLITLGSDFKSVGSSDLALSTASFTSITALSTSIPT